MSGESNSAARVVSACPYCGERQSSSICAACGGHALVAGDYIVGRELGRGGHGVVYEAVSASTGAPAVVKVLSLLGAQDWKSFELFERGTATLMHLKHPNVPAVYGSDRDEHGRLYQVRERIDGGTLAQRIESHHACPIDVLRTFLTTLLQTLEYLHSLAPPIVHRDIKPANIMLRSEDSWEPVLVDFEALSFGASQTGTTIVVSPGYTAPEQIAGHAVPASDLYSVGAVMLYMLTGTEPSKLPQKAGRHDMSVVAASYEPSIVRVVTRLLAPSLTERYTSANQAINDLYAAAPLAPRTGFAALARSSDAEEWTYSFNVVGVLRWLGVPLIGGALAMFLFAGSLVDLRIQSFASELRDELTQSGFASSKDHWMTTQSIAYKHGLLLVDTQIKSAYLRGTSPLDLIDELKAIDAYDPKGRHRHLDDSERGNTYVRLKGTAVGSVLFWSRERPLDLTLVITSR